MRIKVLFTLLLLLFAGCLQQKFSGIAPNPYPAPDFTPTNQFGERVTLSDFRGKVVVLSFLYTSCPTVCPVITTKFADAAKSLKSKEATFVAITVDLEMDTPERTRKYIEDKGLQGKMYYLTGK